MNGATPSLSFTQYSSTDVLKKTLHTWGDFRAIGEDFIFYTGSGFYGTVITTGRGFNYGESASLAITTENPDLAVVLAYSTCSSTPLAAGQTRSSGPAPTPTPTPTPAPGGTGDGSSGAAENSAPSPLEPSIGLDLRGVVGGSTGGANIDIVGLSLPEASTYSLSVFSTQRALTSGAVGGNGSFSGLIPLPTDLGPGTHTVVLRATLPSGEILELRRQFTIASDGTFTSVGDTTVGSAVPVDDPNLASTGVRSSSLPWWALLFISLGLVLVLYSLRARRIVELAEATAFGGRTPWEILSTPIRVPGFDYIPGHGEAGESVSLAEAMQELDVAFSRIIVSGLDSLQARLAAR
jgi:hypothetical protein